MTPKKPAPDLILAEPALPKSACANKKLAPSPQPPAGLERSGNNSYHRFRVGRSVTWSSRWLIVALIDRGV
jgi:hypothetical protein